MIIPSKIAIAIIPITIYNDKSFDKNPIHKTRRKPGKSLFKFEKISFNYIFRVKPFYFKPYHGTCCFIVTGSVNISGGDIRSHQNAFSAGVSDGHATLDIPAHFPFRGVLPCG